MTDYPTSDQLAQIEAWPAKDPTGWLAFVKSCWYAADWGWSEDTEIGDGGQPRRYYRISTAGSSDNEWIIAAMRRNVILWATTWYSSRRGGHYEFRVEGR